MPNTVYGPFHCCCSSSSSSSSGDGTCWYKFVVWWDCTLQMWSVVSLAGATCGRNRFGIAPGAWAKVSTQPTGCLYAYVVQGGACPAWPLTCVDVAPTAPLPPVVPPVDCACGSSASGSSSSSSKGSSSSSSAGPVSVCGCCHGTDPTTFLVSISGVSFCACVSCGGFNYKATGTLPNGTFCLTKLSGQCKWRGASGTVFVNTYTTNSCTTADQSVVASGVRIEVTCNNDGTWTLEAYIPGTGTNPSVNIELFKATIAGGGACGDSLNFTNGVTCGCTAGANYLLYSALTVASGGSATATPNAC